MNVDNIRVVTRRNFLAMGTAATAGIYLAGNEVIAKTPDHAGKFLDKVTDNVTDQDREYMRQAIRLMRQAGVTDKTGGPFGAVIVKDGQILAATGNSVLKDKDPSAHAEVNAIRQACRKIDSHDLSGAVLYSSCELCPMCYATAYWARISKVFFAAAWTDYDDLFDDLAESQDMAKLYSKRKLKPQQILQAEGQKVWDEFRKLPDGARY
ncbi:nucleoside deaminase [Candidatus Methylospira mobilis]|nr:nucleoside deaminase [Candidatus Methylospira mobilis]